MSVLLVVAVVLLVCIGLTLPVALLVYGTKRKNRWGVNVQRPVCPRCGAAQPQVRAPKNLRQMLWGGTICPGCGAELDKWGREAAR